MKTTQLSVRMNFPKITSFIISQYVEFQFINLLLDVFSSNLKKYAFGATDHSTISSIYLMINNFNRIFFVENRFFDDFLSFFEYNPHRLKFNDEVELL